jgi:predicted nucleotidyltransferase
MNPNDPNVARVEVVAARLGALRERLVFVGGCAAGLLVTDPALPAIRATEDVDVAVEAATLTDYYKLEGEIAAAGFSRDLRPGAPICRWRLREAVLDLMPADKAILGFANRWYPLAIRSARATALPSGAMIRLIHAPVFIATKLEAFADRGKGDFLMSHDLGDALAVVDGREELLAEFADADPELANYVGGVLARLLKTPQFASALPGHLPGDEASQARLPDLEAKLARLAALT